MTGSDKCLALFRSMSGNRESAQRWHRYAAVAKPRDSAEWHEMHARLFAARADQDRLALKREEAKR